MSDKENSDECIFFTENLQKFVEQNLEKIFGIVYLTSGYKATDRYNMGSIAMDNDSPVVVKYRNRKKQDIIKRGIDCLSYLKENESVFKTMVYIHLGKKYIDWDDAKVICIANNFTKKELASIDELKPIVILVKFEIADGIINFNIIKRNH